MEVDSTVVLLTALLRLAVGVALLLAGRWLAGAVRRWTRAGLQRAHTPPALTNTLERIVYYGTLLLVAFFALVMFGIPPEFLIAVLGFIVVIAAVSLRETLRDLAATVIILVFQPFAVGDRIETGGIVGDVQEILLFNTVLTTLDSRKLIIPNGLIQNSNLINYTALDKIRLDLPVQVSYADDLSAARSALLQTANADARVLPEPAPRVDVMQLGDNGVGLVLRLFTKPADIWGLRPALTEQIKLEFDRRQITFPFPQLHLHVDSNAAAIQPAALEPTPN
jgi:small conductance mechanosensitive channel